MLKIQFNLIKAILLGNLVCAGKQAPSPRFLNLCALLGTLVKLVSEGFYSVRVAGKIGILTVGV